MAIIEKVAGVKIDNTSGDNGLVWAEDIEQLFNIIEVTCNEDPTLEFSKIVENKLSLDTQITEIDTVSNEISILREDTILISPNGGLGDVVNGPDVDVFTTMQYQDVIGTVKTRQEVLTILNDNPDYLVVFIPRVYDDVTNNVLREAAIRVVNPEDYMRSNNSDILSYTPIELVGNDNKINNVTRFRMRLRVDKEDTSVGAVLGSTVLYTHGTIPRYTLTFKGENNFLQITVPGGVVTNEEANAINEVLRLTGSPLDVTLIVKNQGAVDEEWYLDIEYSENVTLIDSVCINEGIYDDIELIPVGAYDSTITIINSKLLGPYVPSIFNAENTQYTENPATYIVPGSAGNADEVVFRGVVIQKDYSTDDTTAYAELESGKTRGIHDKQLDGTSAGFTTSTLSDIITSIENNKDVVAGIFAAGNSTIPVNTPTNLQATTPTSNFLTYEYYLDNKAAWTAAITDANNYFVGIEGSNLFVSSPVSIRGIESLYDYNFGAPSEGHLPIEAWKYLGHTSKLRNNPYNINSKEDYTGMMRTAWANTENNEGADVTLAHQISEITDVTTIPYEINNTTHLLFRRQPDNDNLITLGGFIASQTKIHSMQIKNNVETEKSIVGLNGFQSSGIVEIKTNLNDYYFNTPSPYLSDQVDSVIDGPSLGGIERFSIGRNTDIERIGKTLFINPTMVEPVDMEYLQVVSHTGKYGNQHYYYASPLLINDLNVNATNELYLREEFSINMCPFGTTDSTYVDTSKDLGFYTIPKHYSQYGIRTLSIGGVSVPNIAIKELKVGYGFTGYSRLANDVEAHVYSANHKAFAYAFGPYTTTTFQNEDNVPSLLRKASYHVRPLPVIVFDRNYSFSLFMGTNASNNHPEMIRMQADSSAVITHDASGFGDGYLKVLMPEGGTIVESAVFIEGGYAQLNGINSKLSRISCVNGFGYPMASPNTCDNRIQTTTGVNSSGDVVQTFIDAPYRDVATITDTTYGNFNSELSDAGRRYVTHYAAVVSGYYLEPLRESASTKSIANAPVRAKDESVSSDLTLYNHFGNERVQMGFDGRITTTGRYAPFRDFQLPGGVMALPESPDAILDGEYLAPNGMALRCSLFRPLEDRDHSDVLIGTKLID